MNRSELFVISRLYFQFVGGISARLFATRNKKPIPNYPIEAVILFDGVRSVDCGG
jgi:hypothetical protein